MAGDYFAYRLCDADIPAAAHLCAFCHLQYIQFNLFSISNTTVTIYRIKLKYHVCINKTLYMTNNMKDKFSVFAKCYYCKKKLIYFNMVM